MNIRLVEFKNNNDNFLRGIAVVPEVVTGRGAVFLQGFERNATVEKKFRRMADALAARGIVSLRYDAAGCGLSDGDFSKTTLLARADELMVAVGYLRKEFAVDKISFVAHSLGVCAIALKLKYLEGTADKMVFIAPALNQRELLRYYFVRDSMNAKNFSVEISWSNWQNYFNEKKFLADCNRPARMMRDNYLAPDYFLEAAKIDLSNYFDKIKEMILHVHGEADRSVPLESLNTEFHNRIIVPAGDHDLERPIFFEQWFPQAVDFLAS